MSRKINLLHIYLFTCKHPHSPAPLHFHHRHDRPSGHEKTHDGQGGARQRGGEQSPDIWGQILQFYTHDINADFKFAT